MAANKVIQWVLFAFLAFFTVSWWLTSFEIFDASAYYEIGFGIAASIVLFVQSGIVTYFKQSQYKTINTDDFVTYFLAFSAASVFISTILVFPKMDIVLPNGLESFLVKTKFVVGIIALIVMLASIYTQNKKR